MYQLRSLIGILSSLVLGIGVFQASGQVPRRTSEYEADHRAEHD